MPAEVCLAIATVALVALLAYVVYARRKWLRECREAELRALYEDERRFIAENGRRCPHDMTDPERRRVLERAWEEYRTWTRLLGVKRR